MVTDTRAERLQPGRRRAATIAADLQCVLHGAEKPLALGELSLRLGRPHRTVAFALAAACRAGAVERLEGGMYSLGLRPALTELFDLVRACEMKWEEDRLGLRAGTLRER